MVKLLLLLFCVFFILYGTTRILFFKVFKKQEYIVLSCYATLYILAAS